MAHAVATVEEKLRSISTAVADLADTVPVLQPAVQLVVGGVVQLPGNALPEAQAIATGINRIFERLDDINTELHDMRTDIRTIQVTQKLDGAWGITRIQNSKATALSHPLSALATRPIVEPAPAPLPALGPPPIAFPRTLRQLRDLTGPQLNQILAAYDLPIEGTTDERRERLASHIGCVL
ncbi:uncharacterized protein LOC62_05G007335 [Vanrija pseudolonga]|uniref:Mug135-like C-terminal domain-containing protein n=1 Tax=Vanrija pseudolonga TaxID=143232 RepID=A0AAF0YBU0_9TREE|nr:hypothetical protein LOC62_05G007335 [Vanrija pseudolonga]